MTKEDAKAVVAPAERIELRDMWPVDKLIPYVSNPRKNDHVVEQLASAIHAFGFRVPILAKSDGTIVDGHLRLKAAKHLGMATVPVILTDDMSDIQIKAFRISVNRMAELSEWDEELLSLEFQDLKDVDFDLSVTGFDDAEIDALLHEIDSDKTGLTDPDAVPEVPETPVTVLGDIWVLGKHRLMCGDSTRTDAVVTLMAGQKADILFTDPPYGVDYDGINNDSREGLADLLAGAFANYVIAGKPGAAFYCFHSDRCSDIFHAAYRAICHFSSMIIWVKPSLVLSQTDYQSQHEPCLYGWLNGAPHLWYSDRKQTSVWSFGKESVSGHPTPKPVDLICLALNNSSKPKQIVADLFGGSGSTLIAAEKAGRIACLMELDPKYCDVIVKRWQDFTGKAALRAADSCPFDSLRQ